MSLAFLAPLWLVALALLPVLYWLLRVTPPSPRHTRFPAIALIARLIPKEETPARTPLWLLLLRLALAALLIVALAHPLINPGARFVSTGPLLLVIDDGWAAARNWRDRQEAIGDLIDRAEREDRFVIVLATAAAWTGEPPRASRPLRAAEARALLAAVEPKPWPIDRAAARTAIDQIAAQQAQVVYLADGMDDAALVPLLERLQRLGAVEVLLDPLDRRARLLLPPVNEGAALVLTAHRPEATGTATTALRALTDDGRTIARQTMNWDDGQPRATARFELPSELRNRIARFEIEAEASAGATVLVDERWRRRPVGVVSGGSLERAQPLLADTYYIERALNASSEVRLGSIPDHLGRPTAVIVLADVGRLADGDREALEAWVRRGGVLIRFAGPRLAESGDTLVPVALRADGGRAFGGAMTWTQPQTLAPFANNSPFAGLTIPDDVRVTRQVLAEPGLDVADHTWARLGDGSPVVTADRRDQGWVILFHVTPTPEWSNLALSGLFVQMLERIAQVSQGVGAATSERPLPPLLALDGFARLVPPPPAAVAIAGGEFAQTSVTPRNPPGFYGEEGARRALNLSAAIQPPRAIGVLPAGVTSAAYVGSRTVDLRAWAFLAALALLLIDLLASLMMRGLLIRRAAPAAAALLLALTTAASAQSLRPPTPAPAPPPGAPADEVALSAAITARLAFVRTGNADIDLISRAGLAGLGQVLARRTAVDIGQPVGIDVAEDELAFFPLLYWPVTPETPRPAVATLRRVQTYLRSGGMILFDTRDAGALTLTRDTGQSPVAQRLRGILSGLDLGRLATIPNDHVLTRSFYLLREFPGRFAGGTVWVEQTDERVNDGVSPVVIGANDWAAAWAVDPQGRPIYPTVPGGETQREFAVRFGVNLVMYALTGNYKADQVHVEAIMERLRR